MLFSFSKQKPELLSLHIFIPLFPPRGTERTKKNPKLKQKDEYIKMERETEIRIKNKNTRKQNGNKYLKTETKWKHNRWKWKQNDFVNKAPLTIL